MGISVRSTQLPWCTGTTPICPAKYDSNETKDAAASSAQIPSSGSLGKAPDVPACGWTQCQKNRQWQGAGRRGQHQNPAECRQGAHGLKVWLHRALTPMTPIPGMVKGSL